MEQLFGNVIIGLALGSVYSLVALGFVVIYKATKVVNFAQGELVMVGAYVCFALTVQAGLPFWLSFILTLGFSIILALAIERLVLRPLIGEPVISVIMVTIGLSAVFRTLVQLFWGTTKQKFPEVLPEATVTMGGMPVALEYIVAFGLALMLFTVFSLFFKFSRSGVAMRATAFDQMAAASMGIGIKNIFAMSWCIAAVVSCFGGVVVGVIQDINSDLGQVGLLVFPAVILGGLDSLLGAALGGLFIGVLQKVCEHAASEYLGLGGFGNVASFIFLVIILMIRPYGLFGTEEIERV